jgi:hypothetical protein
MATITEIQVYRGEDVTLNFTMAPVVDITGWTITFTVAQGANQKQKIIQKSCTLVTPASGTFKADLLAVDTDITPSTYFWDAWRMENGSRRVLAAGAFVVLPDARLP